MKFILNDGGRAAAGYRGTAGDCVTRAVAIASGRPYQEIYQLLSSGAGSERRSRGRSARNGIFTSRKWFKAAMESLGFRWVPTMHIGSGCQVHLTDGELPMGRLVVSVSKHYTAVIDGVIHDTWNPEREIAVFSQFEGWQTADLKPGEQRNQNGVFSIRRRCVYGYWELVTSVPEPTSAA